MHISWQIFEHSTAGTPPRRAIHNHVRICRTLRPTSHVIIFKSITVYKTHVFTHFVKVLLAFLSRKTIQFAPRSCQFVLICLKSNACYMAVQSNFWATDSTTSCTHKSICRVCWDWSCFLSFSSFTLLHFVFSSLCNLCLCNLYMSVRPPYNNRRASSSSDVRGTSRMHWRPSPTVPDQPTDAHGWKVHSSATVDTASSTEVLNGSKLPWRCYGLGFSCKFLDAALTLPSFPTAPLSASVTFAERPSIKNWRMRPDCCTAVVRTS